MFCGTYFSYYELQWAAIVNMSILLSRFLLISFFKVDYHIRKERTCFRFFLTTPAAIVSKLVSLVHD